MTSDPEHDGRVDGLDTAALLAALRAAARGDFRARLPATEAGTAGAIAEAFNDLVELNERTAAELRRISRDVGRNGRIRQRASVGGGGEWRRSVDAVNQLVLDL